MNKVAVKDKSLTKGQLQTTIKLLIHNLVNLSDPTGEFSVKVADGSIIDNKSFDYWEWTSGIGLYGMMKYFQLTRDKKVLESIVSWYDKHLTGEPVEKNINTMVQMLTLSYLYEETGNKAYLPFLKQWGKWLYYDLPRTERGGFQHVTFGDLNPNEMWDDTLMMSVLTIAKLGTVLNKKEYIEEAKKQFLLHIQFLQDRETGLWYHGWTFNKRNNFGKAFWGRGNCWITIAIPEFLSLIGFDKNDGYQQFILTSLEYQLDSLQKYQDSKTGLWHTLVDDSSSYLEGSATAGFTYGILKALNNNMIDTHYLSVAEKGIQALLNNIDENGGLAHVSAGTPMGADLDFYKNIKISIMPYGQSMASLALTEYLKKFY
ncbi:glycoside hydrolase family 88 protein [Lactobacillus sp. UCMA15818]|uniref:beta-galactosidase BglB n=1 Tax=Lactobacillus sp. UCMA15818 TaxID=2583394 RepID=UPI0025B065BE|nr:glycoside hydrolase family 88 protein [Lactobacillus sp. UCMA15818]MDN2453162.1 glycoside hydrolase family 105 protein [Lactobacillus sp. UCMA15818]